MIGVLAQRSTVLVSTHILQEVQAVCQRVVILRAGRKVLDSRMDELQRGARLLVTVDGDEAKVRAVLAAVPGVAAVESAGKVGPCFRFALRTEQSAAPAVSAAVHNAGFGLHALAFERRDLETLFAEIDRAAPAQVEEVRHAA